ncbi:MAG: hypothetical protein ACYDHO_03040 [Gaiellaceae bacterium]
MDQTGSEESKQPGGEGAKPSEQSEDERRTSIERSGQGGSPESAHRAFDLLERFSGELEEILQSLERARGGAAPAEESSPAPERAYRPSSIHFDSSPISTRVDPGSLPPVDSPGATSRTAPRLILEALLQGLVAAVSARTGLRPLLIVAAEAVAFLIVASIELAVTREKRQIRRFPAATPSFVAAAPEPESASAVRSFTLEQIEPLIWQSDWQEAVAEAEWPLTAYEPPNEAEAAEEAQEGVTEISSAQQPETVVRAAPETQPEVDPEGAAAAGGGEPEVVPEPEAAPEPEPEISSESTDEIPATEAELERETEIEPEVVTEPEVEIAGDALAAEIETEQPRRRHFFRREAGEAEVAAEAESAEPEIEPEVESPEIVAEAPEQPRRFHFSRHEPGEAEIDLDGGAEIPAAEADLEREATVEPEVVTEPEVEIAGDALAAEVEAEQPRHFHLFRRGEIESEAEPEVGLEAAEPDIAAEVESPPEIVAEEPEQPRHFHLFRREESEAEPEVGLEAAEPEIDAEVESPEIVAEAPEQPRHFHLLRHEDEAVEGVEPEAELESAFEVSPTEVEPEQPRRFHLFRQEQSEPEPETELESTAEIPAAEVELEREAEAESVHEVFAAENEPLSPAGPEVELDMESLSEIAGEEIAPEPPRRFHLFRHEERALEAESAQEVANEAEVAAGEESLYENGAEEVEPEQPRHFHLFRRGEIESEAEPEAELGGAEPDIAAADIAAEVEIPPEIVAEEPEQPRRFHLFRREPGEPDLDPEPEVPSGPDESLEELPDPERSERLVGFTGPVETIEIELPPETAVAEIERTLEDLGRYEPDLRRRRWSRRAESDKHDAMQALEEEPADGESEVRLSAERERRRREREYLRSLRVSR